MDLQGYLTVIFVSALPIGELRAGIPLALTAYNMKPIWAYLLGVIGNIIPVILLLLFLERLTKLLSKISLFSRFLHWLFAYTRMRQEANFKRFGAAALVLFVAIPLPATGAWTGSLLAHIFGVQFKYAFPLITLGVMLAGLLVTLSTLGILRFF